MGNLPASLVTGRASFDQGNWYNFNSWEALNKLKPRDLRDKVTYLTRFNASIRLNKLKKCPESSRCLKTM